MSFQIHKKGFVASVLVDMFAFLAFALIVLVFFFLFKFKAQTVESTIHTASEIDGLGVNIVLLNFLRTQVQVNGEDMTIADIISMVDIEEGKEERIKAFQGSAEKIFEQQYPRDDIAWEIVPYWIKVYDADENIHTDREGEYFKLYPIPGEGYIYAPGVCKPGDTENNLVTTFLVPKANGENTKLVFCISRHYINK